MSNNCQARRAQATALASLDAALAALDKKSSKLLDDETHEMVFRLVMDCGGVLPRNKLNAVRAIIRAFHAERELATQKAIEISRRRLQVLLQDEPQPIVRFFERWSKN